MEWIEGFLQGPFYMFGIGIWNGMLLLIGAASRETPMGFSALTWDYLTVNVYPFTVSIGVALLNIFFFVGFFRTATDLKHNFTIEAFIEVCIRLVVANILLLCGLDIMSNLLKMSAALADLQLVPGISFQQKNLDIGSTIFYLFFGILFFIVCVVCSMMVFLAVYGRFLQIYLLVATAPLAFGVLPGGSGFGSAFGAWLKTFLAKTFEILIIVLAISLGSKMSNSIDFGSVKGVGGVLDGCVMALQNMATMILMTATIKGADGFMRRTFGL